MQRSLVAFTLSIAAFVLTGRSTTEQLVVCGGDEVVLIDVAQAAKSDPTPLWRWQAKDHPELPAAFINAFRTVDDCKPVQGGTKILISSSSSGCALVEYPSGRVLWYGIVPMSHSLELLPGDRLIAAASTSPKGNRLMLFDIARPDQLVWEAPLLSAHGVVWDAERQIVWALGHDELRSYELQDWKSATPKLVLRASHALPDVNGHDLLAVPNSSDLVLSTQKHVFLFNRETLEFRPHPELGDVGNVKCVSTHPTSGRIAYLYGENKTWWTERISLLTPAGEIRLPGKRLYKARWLVP